MRSVEVLGAVRLLGARVGGDLDCDGSRLRSLSAAGATVWGSLFLRPGEWSTKIRGVLDLTNASISTVADDPSAWPEPGNLILNRCTYDAFTGKGISSEERIRWLKLQARAEDALEFMPQPWEQCAKVLREMGHAEDARAILIEKERLQRADRRKRYRRDGKWLRSVWAGFWDFVLGITVRYGRQPLFAFLWLAGFWLAGWAAFAYAAAQDAVKPNNPFVLRSAEWAQCVPPLYGPPHPDNLDLDPAAGEVPRWNDSYTSQLDCFRAQPEAESYPVFRYGIYSADTLLPIVHLEMQEFWIPDGDHRVGAWARTFLWIQIAMGWALSLLAVAGFSGLVKSD